MYRELLQKTTAPSPVEISQKTSNAGIASIMWRNHALPIGLIVALHHHIYDRAIAKQSRDWDTHYNMIVVFFPRLR